MFYKHVWTRNLLCKVIWLSLRPSKSLTTSPSDLHIHSHKNSISLTSPLGLAAIAFSLARENTLSVLGTLLCPAFLGNSLIKGIYLWNECLLKPVTQKSEPRAHFLPCTKDSCPSGCLRCLHACYCRWIGWHQRWALVNSETGNYRKS